MTPDDEDTKLPVTRAKANSLDSPQAMKQHRKLYAYYLSEMDRQWENRALMARDHDLYDGDQLPPEVLEVLHERGQYPVIYNVTATTIDWILGNEKRNRKDFRVLARRSEHGKQAELKTDLMKYFSDVNDEEIHISRSFRDAAIGGVGWIEDYVSDDNQRDLIETRYESWRNILWDSLSIHDDLRDARYLFRSRWVDADMLAARFPKRQGLIEQSVSTAYRLGYTAREDGDEFMDSQEEHAESSGPMHIEYEASRDRVRCIEAWYRKIEPTSQKLIGGQFHNEFYDDLSEGHEYALKAGESELVTQPAMRMHVAIMTPQGLLWNGLSPYMHNDFPFTPIWGYRRDRDNMPYGIPRRIYGLQLDINLRGTKATHILNTNKTIMETGAVDDLDEFLEQRDRPDGVIVVNPNKRLEIDAERGLDASHLEHMSRNISMVQQVGGVTDENMGRTTNAKSGIAIQSRQDQGVLTTLGLYDNLRFGRKMHGQKLLSLIEQWFTEPRQIRITNARGNATFRDVNSPGDPEDHIARTKADYIMGEQDWSISMRQARGEMLFEVGMQLVAVHPNAAFVLIIAAIEQLSLPDGDVLVKQLREVTGVSDPDQEEKSPEDVAREQAQAEAMQRQIRMQIAEIEAKEAEAKVKMAQAEKFGGDVQKIQSAIAREGMDTFNVALQAALQAVSTPAVVPVADEMLREAGFKGRTEQEDDAAVDEKAAQLEAMAAQNAASQQQPPIDPSQEEVQ